MSEQNIYMPYLMRIEKVTEEGTLKFRKLMPEKIWLEIITCVF